MDWSKIMLFVREFTEVLLGNEPMSTIGTQTQVQPFFRMIFIQNFFLLKYKKVLQRLIG